MNLQVKSVVKLCSFFTRKQSLLNIPVRNVIAGQKYFSSSFLQNSSGVHHHNTNFSCPGSPQYRLKVLSKNSCCHNYTQRRQKSTKPSLDSQWVPIYHLKQIRIAAIIQRMKIYQTGFCVVMALPILVASKVYGAIPEYQATLVVAVATFACTMLYVMGTISERMIGFMYISKIDPTLIKIAHLNFWGHRVDDIFLIDDIIPISEQDVKKSDLYIRIQRYSDENTLFYITLRYGLVYDIEEFQEILGSIPPHLVDTVKANQVPRLERPKAIEDDKK